jgi:hypothetical protein
MAFWVFLMNQGHQAVKNYLGEKLGEYGLEIIG